MGFLFDNSNKENLVVEDQFPSVLVNHDSNLKSKLHEYEFVYTLKNKTDNYLGDVYIKKVNDSVFHSLLIINNLEKSTTKLYEISNYILSNNIGIDIEIRKEEFWGYRFELMKNDYFVLTALHDKGKSVTDAISIEWSYEDQIFEVSKAP